MIELVPVVDTDFDWMLGQSRGRLGLSLAPGGVDDARTLALVRGMNAVLLRAHDRGAWMIVHGQEVVGLCSYIRPPANGEVAIGFGVAASRRKRGYATAAVGAMVLAATEDPLVSTILARTALTNLWSQGVLRRNSFAQADSEIDAEDGEVIVWRRLCQKALA